MLQPCQDTDCLLIMIKPAYPGHGGVQLGFPSVTKGRVPEIMGQRASLGQIFIQAKVAGDGPGDLRHL